MKKKIIHTDVVPNLYDVVFPWNTKGDILKVMVIFFRATTINGLDRFKATKKRMQKQHSIQDIIQKSGFCIQHKNERHNGLERQAGEMIFSL